MPNNGTLRLPLVPIGLHSDIPATDDDTPTDLSSDPMPTVPATPITNAPTAQAENESKQNDVEESESIWDYLKAKLDAAKSWAVGVFSSTANTNESTDSNQAQAPR